MSKKAANKPNKGAAGGRGHSPTQRGGKKNSKAQTVAGSLGETSEAPLGAQKVQVSAPSATDKTRGKKAKQGNPKKGHPSEPPLESRGVAVQVKGEQGSKSKKPAATSDVKRRGATTRERDAGAQGRSTRRKTVAAVDSSHGPSEGEIGFANSPFAASPDEAAIDDETGTPERDDGASLSRRERGKMAKPNSSDEKTSGKTKGSEKAKRQEKTRGEDSVVAGAQRDERGVNAQPKGEEQKKPGSKKKKPVEPSVKRGGPPEGKAKPTATDLSAPDSHEVHAAGTDHVDERDTASPAASRAGDAKLPNESSSKSARKRQPVQAAPARETNQGDGKVPRRTPPGAESQDKHQSGKSKGKKLEPAEGSQSAADENPEADPSDGGTGSAQKVSADGLGEGLVDTSLSGEDSADGDDEEDSVLYVGGDEPEQDEDEEELSEEEESHRYLKGIIEALLFASDKPLTPRELARAARIDKKRTLQLLVDLRKEYKHRGVNIVEVGGGVVLRSNPLYGAFVQKALALRPVKLSRAQLETLAIVAYRQPITRPEIDDIRGVDSGQVLKGLADRDLIKMVGKKDEAGRPMLYGTTDAFLELFNLESLKGLPSLREFTELSEDSREKFAQATGEAVAVPPVFDEESVSEEPSAEGAAGQDVSQREVPPGEEGMAEGAGDDERPGEEDFVKDEVHEGEGASDRQESGEPPKGSGGGRVDESLRPEDAEDITVPGPSATDGPSDEDLEDASLLEVSETKARLDEASPDPDGSADEFESAAQDVEPDGEHKGAQGGDSGAFPAASEDGWEEGTEADWSDDELR